jgi:Tol biopolymer transport system component
LTICIKSLRIFRILSICLFILVILISFIGCDIDKKENKTGALITILLLRATVGTSEIVFDYNGTGNYEIYKMKTDGTNVRQLTNDAVYDNWWPRISPDRTKILFYRATKGNKEGDFTHAELCLINADGTGYTVLRPIGKDGWFMQAHAEWSPKGDEIVMCAGISSAIQLVITDPVGTVKRQITGTPVLSMNCDPSWSPDGETIVFDHFDSGGASTDLDIYTIPSNTTLGTTSNMTRLTTNTIDDYDPYYSPNGTTIAWLQKVNATDNLNLGRWAIMKMNANGANQVPVIDDGGINSKPAWSLDGSTIYFHKFVIGDSRWEIYKILPAGTGLGRVDTFTSGMSEFPMN